MSTCDGGPNFRKVSRQTDQDSPEAMKAMNQNETSWGFLILFALSSLWKHRELVLHIFTCWGLEGLNSLRLVADYKTFFAQMSVDAISMLGDDLSVSSVGIKKVTGGSVTDTMLVEGVCFKKCFSYAGFEQQPKRFENAKILLLNLELELKAEKDNAEVRITDPDQYQSIVDAEWNIIYVPRLQTNCRITFVQRSMVHCGCVFSRRLNLFNSSIMISSSSSVFSAAARRSWSWLRSLVLTLC